MHWFVVDFLSDVVYLLDMVFRTRTGELQLHHIPCRIHLLLLYNSLYFLFNVVQLL